MINFLLYHGAEEGDDSGYSAGYYRIQYSSKEKLVQDLTISILNAIERKQSVFSFLEIQMNLEDFGYYSAYFDNDFDKPFACDISVMTLEEWFHEKQVGTEGVHETHEELVLTPSELCTKNKNKQLDSGNANTIEVKKYDSDVTTRLNVALSEMGLEAISKF